MDFWNFTTVRDWHRKVRATDLPYDDLERFYGHTLQEALGSATAHDAGLNWGRASGAEGGAKARKRGASGGCGESAERV